MALWPKSRNAKIRALILVLILLGVAGYFCVGPAIRYSQYQPEEGDIIFQSLPRVTDLVGMIEGVTESPYSHCGVVVKENGKWRVAESIGTVRKTSLFKWVMRGRGGKFAVYRLKEEYRKDIPRFIRELEPFMGKPYDFKYRMDDDALYCSELVYRAYKNATGEQLGLLVKLGDMNWKPHETTIRKYEGGPPPLELMMITPKHLSRAAQLEKVFGGDF